MVIVPSSTAPRWWPPRSRSTGGAATRAACRHRPLPGRRNGRRRTRSSGVATPAPTAARPGHHTATASPVAVSAQSSPTDQVVPGSTTRPSAAKASHTPSPSGRRSTRRRARLRAAEVGTADSSAAAGSDSPATTAAARAAAPIPTRAAGHWSAYAEKAATTARTPATPISGLHGTVRAVGSSHAGVSTLTSAPDARAGGSRRPGSGRRPGHRRGARPGGGTSRSR